jgi:hypothetical protein
MGGNASGAGSGPNSLDTIARQLPLNQPDGLIVHNAEDIKPQPIRWLWHHRFPEAMISLIAGEGGDGKSQITVTMAATISKGGPWPHGEGRAPLGSTLIISSEDSPEHTIVPRLRAAGADLSRIKIVHGIYKANKQGAFTLQPESLVFLEKYIKEQGDIKLVILDPISSFMGKVDAFKNSEVRSVIDPLAELTNRLNFAVIAITHLGKAKTANGKSKILDSVAFVNGPRVAYVVEDNPEVPGGHILLLRKDNIIPKGLPMLTYHSENFDFNNEDGLVISAPRIAWDKPVMMDASGGLPVTLVKPPRLLDTAIEKIVETLKASGGGCQPMKQVLDFGLRSGIAVRTMLRAKAELGPAVESIRRSTHFEWCLCGEVASMPTSLPSS